MMNVLELQDKLKNFSEDQLVNEMQQPSGSVPQYLVLSEINRRKRIRDDYQQQQQSQQPQMTVAQEKLAGSGVPEEGLAGLAAAMAPKTDMTENTGATPDQTMPMPEAPAPMAELPQEGGIATMAKGGYVRRYQPGGFMGAQELPPLTSGDYPVGAGRATMIDGIFVELLPDGSVVDARTRQPVPPEVSQKARGKLMQPAGAGMFDPSRPIASSVMGGAQAGSNELMQNEAQLLDEERGRSILSQGVNPSFEQTRRMQDEFGIGIADRRGQPPSTPAAPEFSPVFDATTDTPIASALAPRGPESAAAQTAPSAQGDFHEPSGLYFEEMADAQLMALANGGDQRAAAELGRRSGAQPAPAAPAPGQTTDPRAVSQGEVPGFVQRIMEGIGTMPPQIGGYELEYPAPAVDSEKPPSLTAPESADELNPPMDRTALLRRMTADDAYTYTPPEPTTPDAEAPPAGGGTGAGAGGVGGGSRGAGGAGGAGGGYGSVESQIIELLKAREKRAESDKWLALAEAGLALMASDQPTLGGAIGEAGQVGLSGLRASRDEYESAKMDLLKMQQSLASARASAAKGRDYNTPTTIGAALDRFESMREGLLGRGSAIVTDPLTGEEKIQTVYRTYNDLSPDEKNLYDSYSARIADLSRKYTGFFPADMTQ